MECDLLYCLPTSIVPVNRLGSGYFCQCQTLGDSTTYNSNLWVTYKQTNHIMRKQAFPYATSWENRFLGFPTRSDTNWPVQSQKQARSLKFRIREEETLYFLWRENKGADQLCSYCTADLRLCFHKGKIRFPHDEGHMWKQRNRSAMQKKQSHLCLASRIVQPLFFFSPKFYTSSLLLWQYR